MFIQTPTHMHMHLYNIHFELKFEQLNFSDQMVCVSYSIEFVEQMKKWIDIKYLTNLTIKQVNQGKLV